MIWSAPLMLNMLATSLAVIGARDLSFLSCLKKSTVLHLLLVGNILWLLWCWESGKIQKKYRTFLGLRTWQNTKESQCEKPGRVMRYCMLWYQLLSFKIETKTKPEGRLTRSKTACVRDLHSFKDGLALLRLVFQHYACEDLYWSGNYCPHYQHLHDIIITIDASSSKSTSLACIRPILLEVIRVLNLRIILLIINIGGGLIDPKLPKTKKS